MNAKLGLSTLLCVLLLASCAQGASLVLPEMDESEREILSFVRKQKVRSIAYHHASIEDDDLILIVSYPAWSDRQIELLGLAVLQSAQEIFSAYPGVNQFTFYAANGSRDPQKKHFLTLTRALWENPSITITDGPAMAYEIAQNYFVGPAVKGTLGFMRGDEYIPLPLQKPMP